VKAGRWLALAAAFALSTAVGPSPAVAQDESPEGTARPLVLDDFRLAGPPALLLLGVSPASVTRPPTPRALIASLVSAAGSSGLVPNGFAMETAPFWLVRHPDLQLQQYYNASFGDRLRYFTAFSVATTRESAKRDTVPQDAHVAVAMRTLLLNGHPSAALTRVSESMRREQLAYITAYRRWERAKPAASPLAAQRKRLMTQEELLSTLVTRMIAGDHQLRDSTLRTLARRDSARSAVAAAELASEDVARLDAEMERLDKRLSKLGEDFAEEDLDPEGLVVEVAAGTRAAFAKGEWSDERLDGIGFWITPAYRLSASHLSFAGTARYLTRVAEYDEHAVFDVGGRAGIDFRKATLSAEYVRRSVSNNSSARWAALFSYLLPANLELTGSFGSDFRKSSGARPVIATIGLDLGLGAITLTPR
jgi:hypothetical protein